jgi:hypothetical protein
MDVRMDVVAVAVPVYVVGMRVVVVGVLVISGAGPAGARAYPVIAAG